MEKKKKKKDPLAIIMEELEKYDEGCPPKKMESCCKHGEQDDHD